MAIHRILISLFLHKMSIAKLIAFSRDVQAGMGADTTNFPSPDPTLAQTKSDTDALEQLEAKLKTDKTLKDARDAGRAGAETGEVPGSTGPSVCLPVGAPLQREGEIFGVRSPFNATPRR
jgi:hypothetical protein